MTTELGPCSNVQCPPNSHCGCVKGCENTCDNPYEVYACDNFRCQYGCVCDKEYVFNKQKCQCVTPEECNGSLSLSKMQQCRIMVPFENAGQKN